MMNFNLSSFQLVFIIVNGTALAFYAFFIYWRRLQNKKI